MFCWPCVCILFFHRLRRCILIFRLENDKHCVVYAGESQYSLAVSQPVSLDKVMFSHSDDKHAGRQASKQQQRPLSGADVIEK